MGATAADEGALFGVYGFFAAEFGWTVKEVNEALTDEQIIGILDDAPRRLNDRFVASVEAVRTGTVIAHDKRAATRWRTRAAAATGGGAKAGLSGMALEHAVRSLAATNPEYVVEGA